MSEKPTGPIWIDFAPSLFNQLTGAQLVLVANLAMNRLTMRDIGEIFGEAGLRPELGFTDQEMSP